MYPAYLFRREQARLLRLRGRRDRKLLALLVRVEVVGKVRPRGPARLVQEAVRRMAVQRQPLGDVLLQPLGKVLEAARLGPRRGEDDAAVETAAVTLT